MPVVGKYKELWYLFLFISQTLVCLVFVILWESNPVAAFRTMGAVIIVTTATSITTVEVVRMLADRYLERRYKEGLKDGREEIREEIERLKKRIVELESPAQHSPPPPPAKV